MGFILGLFSSATFGLIPLFSLPLLHAGVSVQTALVYRFGLAALTLWLILGLRRERFAVRGIDLCKLAALSAFYMLAVFLFFESFRHLPSGVAATIQFLYPLMVLLIMVLFFHERFSWRMGAAVALAVAGVAMLGLCQPGTGGGGAAETAGPGIVPGVSALGVTLALLAGVAMLGLCQPGTGGGGAAETAGPGIVPGVSALGVTLALLAGLANALYMVGIQVARIPNINGLVMTFYVMAFGTLIATADGLCRGTLQWLHTAPELVSAILLALVTAVLSNLTLILAIQRIGSAITSVLGVMEPLTAVAVGVAVFGEPFTPALAGGVALIAAAVLTIMLGPRRRNAA